MRDTTIASRCRSIQCLVANRMDRVADTTVTRPPIASGKIDRRALPPPDMSGMGRARETVAPRDTREQALADVCADVLKLKAFSVHDSLFDLGGP